MNSTSAVEVSIQAVSPELIFDESTENGAVGAAGAAAAEAAEASGAAGAEAVAGADASSAYAVPTPPARSDTAISKDINKDINNLRIFRFLWSLFECLQGVRAGLAGADPNHFLERNHEDLAVADLAGVRGALDCFRRLLDGIVRNDRLDLHLRQELDRVFGASIQLRMSLLTSEPLHFRHRHP